MEELLEEFRKLKERVSILETKNESDQCYKNILGNAEYSIEHIVQNESPFYIQLCDLILEHQILTMTDSKIYICHKGGNQELKEVFAFVENLIIIKYNQYVNDNDNLTAEQFDKYNTIIYSLNLTKNLSKIKKYISDKIKGNI